jgi:hypothetical protein
MATGRAQAARDRSAAKRSGYRAAALGVAALCRKPQNARQTKQPTILVVKL